MKDIFKVLENFASDALIDKDDYIKMYNESINDSVDCKSYNLLISSFESSSIELTSNS